MSEVRIVYGYCDNNCKYPVYTKEDVVGLLEYVIANNALPPDIIIDGEINNNTKIAAVNAITEQNNGAAIKFWRGTQAQYDAYTGDKTNLFAIITDDSTMQDIFNQLGQHSETINKILSGEIPVGNAVNVTTNINGKAISSIFESNGTTAKTATNAIKKADNTFIGFTQDTNGVLKAGTEIVSKKVLILDTGDVGVGGVYSDNKNYTMPAELTEIGKYEVEFGDGTIQTFVNKSGSITTTLRVNRTAMSDSNNTLQHYINIYVLDYTARTITLSKRKYYEGSNTPTANWVQVYISKIWKIIE